MSRRRRCPRRGRSGCHGTCSGSCNVFFSVLFLLFCRKSTHFNSGIIHGPEFSYSAQLSTKFILLINVKMPTIVGIVKTFISVINTTSERLKARKKIIIQYFIFYEQLKFRAQRTTKALISLRRCAGLSAPLLFANRPILQFTSRAENIVDPVDLNLNCFQEDIQE